MPNIDKFERRVFEKANALSLLLSFSLKLMQARQVGLLIGTNSSYTKFLPPEKWDRGVIYKFDGRGFAGLVLKYFGTMIVRYKGLSPVRLYKDTQFGVKKDSDGIIPFVLRTHKEFYRKGVKILICDHIDEVVNNTGVQSKISILSYDGKSFESLSELKIIKRIVKLFKAKNFVSAYIPDFGAIVFNTIDEALLEKIDGRFVNESVLKEKLNILIAAIEMASLANIGQVKGRQAAHIIWRKEMNLRKTALELKEKEKQLDEQKKYLKAVGAVNEQQLNMEAINITDGVYAFMDMVGSASIRKKFSPRDYFYILNLCHQITANNANRYSCRVDNFIGDCVFLQNAAPFDFEYNGFAIGLEERIMLMILTISSTFNEIDRLKKGQHEMDPSGRVQKLISDAQIDICYRAGMEVGSAMIGPLGSQRRKIVTAIGKAVNNASRLESSGIKEWIHTSEKVIAIIKEAYITKDTTILREAIERPVDQKKDDFSFNRPMNFLEYYARRINGSENIIEERKNISYKEYSKETSYVIQCLSSQDIRI